MVMFKKAKLRWAIQHGDTKAAQELLGLGINPDAKDDSGRSFLWLAVHHGNRDAVELLLQKGATVDAEVRYNGTLLHMAAYKGSMEIATMLLEKNPGLLALKDSKGNTPLHAAAEYGYPDFVDFMIKKGLDPNQKNFENRTPLSLAQKTSQMEVVDLLKPYAPARAPAPPADDTSAPASAEPDSNWKKLPGERVAHIAVEEAIGYRITEIFNFSARERTTLYQNLETKAETAETRSFDDTGDKTALEQALAELQKRGGKSDISSINGLDKKRLAATP